MIYQCKLLKKKGDEFILSLFVFIMKRIEKWLTVKDNIRVQKACIMLVNK